MDSEGTAAQDLPLRVMPVRPSLDQRAAALIEVALCSDFPTQLLLGATFAALGFSSEAADGSLRLPFVALLSLADTALLVGLMLLFLAVRGDRARDVFFGSRAIVAEARAGIPLIFVAFLIAASVLLLLRAFAPQLHNVERNPLQQLLQTPGDAVLFGLVAVIAGGVREELQRAFLLNRFERWLGGATTGLVITSVAFGAGHWIQGEDAAVATATLGAFWALIYLRRRSIVAPVVSHSGFNLLQLVQFMVVRQ